MLGAATAAAGPEALRGDRFITVMQNNTLSGATAGGARYDMYFLPGGLVTYRDSTGADDRGRWRIDRDGDVCIRVERTSTIRQSQIIYLKQTYLSRRE